MMSEYPDPSKAEFLGGYGVGVSSASLNVGQIAGLDESQADPINSPALGRRMAASETARSQS